MRRPGPISDGRARQKHNPYGVVGSNPITV